MLFGGTLSGFVPLVRSKQKCSIFYTYYTLEGYRNYASEDFVQDDRFRKWVMSNDPETHAYWTGILARFPEKKSAILSARAMLNAMRNLQNLPAEEQGTRMWEYINEKTEVTATEVAPTKVAAMEVAAMDVAEPSVAEPEVMQREPMHFTWRWAAAACITLLLCSLGWYVLTKRAENRSVTYSGQLSQVAVQMNEKVNTTEKTQLVHLPDGSSVELSPGSRISYPATFPGEKREVYFTGKGFFNVVKNDKQPFFVYANRLVTQVVGTSFTVTSSSENAPASVVVKSGKVRVYTLGSAQTADSGRSGNAVVLTPNMQVTYDPAQDRLSKSFIAEPAVINTPKAYPDFLFENTSVSKVFETLEESYGVSIAYDAATVENCDLTAPLGNEPLFRKLDIICQTIGATYQVWGTEIVISGEGCKTE